jgi:hypothetical protein
MHEIHWKTVFGQQIQDPDPERFPVRQPTQDQKCDGYRVQILKGFIDVEGAKIGTTNKNENQDKRRNRDRQEGFLEPFDQKQHF